MYIQRNDVYCSEWVACAWDEEWRWVHITRTWTCLLGILLQGKGPLSAVYITIVRHVNREIFTYLTKHVNSVTQYTSTYYWLSHCRDINYRSRICNQNIGKYSLTLVLKLEKWPDRKYDPQSQTGGVVALASDGGEVSWHQKRSVRVELSKCVTLVMHPCHLWVLSTHNGERKQSANMCIIREMYNCTFQL